MLIYPCIASCGSHIGNSTLPFAAETHTLTSLNAPSFSILANPPLTPDTRIGGLFGGNIRKVRRLEPVVGELDIHTKELPLKTFTLLSEILNTRGIDLFHNVYAASPDEERAPPPPTKGEVLIGTYVNSLVHVFSDLSHIIQGEIKNAISTNYIAKNLKEEDGMSWLCSIISLNFRVYLSKINNNVDLFIASVNKFYKSSLRGDQQLRDFELSVFGDFQLLINRYSMNVYRLLGPKEDVEHKLRLVMTVNSSVSSKTELVILQGRRPIYRQEILAAIGCEREGSMAVDGYPCGSSVEVSMDRWFTANGVESLDSILKLLEISVYNRETNTFKIKDNFAGKAGCKKTAVPNARSSAVLSTTADLSKDKIRAFHGLVDRRIHEQEFSNSGSENKGSVSNSALVLVFVVMSNCLLRAINFFI